jgi:hypothetical protein
MRSYPCCALLNWKERKKKKNIKSACIFPHHNNSAQDAEAKYQSLLFFVNFYESETIFPFVVFALPRGLSAYLSFKNYPLRPPTTQSNNSKWQLVPFAINYIYIQHNEDLPLAFNTYENSPHKLCNEYQHPKNNNVLHKDISLHHCNRSDHTHGRTNGTYSGYTFIKSYKKRKRGGERKNS